MSNEMDAVMADLGRADQTYQGAVDDFDRETARILGINETDQRCLEILLDTGGATPRELATRLGLTAGSVTAMLDRLEKLGHLTRSPHPSDGRKSVVRITSRAAQRAYELHGPHIEDAGRQLVNRYNAEQLRLVIDFMTFSTTIWQRHTERLRALPTPGGRPGSRSE